MTYTSVSVFGDITDITLYDNEPKLTNTMNVRVGDTEITFHLESPGMVQAIRAAWVAERDRAKAAEIADREADNIANGQDVDEPDADDYGDIADEQVF